MKEKIFVITAAGGNATAIQVLNKSLNREDYENLGSKLMSATAKLGVEQCGFLIPDKMHFEMSGGEFCGNAARAAAMLFSEIGSSRQVNFSMSGFPFDVVAIIDKLNDIEYNVSCLFKDFPVKVTKSHFKDFDYHLVDLGGIAHVLIEGNLPDNYEDIHHEITKYLDLPHGAIGVCWIEKIRNSIKMHPVVWVRSIDSFFYEGSCGSGTIATGMVFDTKSVIQPTDESILVDITGSDITLESKMEVTHEFFENELFSAE